MSGGLAGHRSASASGFLISLCRVHDHTSPTFIAYLQYNFLILLCQMSIKGMCTHARLPKTLRILSKKSKGGHSLEKIHIFHTPHSNGKCRATTQWAMVLLMGVGQVFAIGNDRYWWATIGNLGQWCYDRLLSWLFSRAVGRRRVPRDICSITNYRVRWIIPQMQRTVQPLCFAVRSAEGGG